MKRKKEKDSEDIMNQIKDINVGKVVNCFICKSEIPIRQIKEHVKTCKNKKQIENKTEVVGKIQKINKEIKCDLCDKKFTYNTALYKHFKNIHHQTYKKKEPKKGAKHPKEKRKRVNKVAEE